MVFSRILALNTNTRGLFHSMCWSPGLNLNNPRWRMISQCKSPCIRLTTYVISAYLVQTPREIRKLKYCVWARLVKPTFVLCLCTFLSLISGYAITGATSHWFWKIGRIDSSPPLVPHVCASEMNPENGPTLVQIISARLFGAKPLPKVILTYCKLHSWD